MKTFFLLLVAMVFTLNAEARRRFTERDRQNAVIQGTQQAGQISDSAQAGNGTTSTSYQTLEQSSRDTTTNSQKGQTTATIMQIGLYGMAAMYGAQCGSQNYGACVKAGIAAVMGSQAGRSSDSFDSPIDTSWQNSCTFSSMGCSGTPPNPYTASLTPDVINTGKSDADLAAAKDGLSKGGYAVDVNSGKIKGPNGEVNANDPSSMEGALGADGLKSLMSEVGKLERDAKAKVDQVKSSYVNAALGFDGGAGNIGAVGEGYGAGGSVASRLDKLRNPAQAKGLTKNFNGDPIGVASDSIFEMMSRRYHLKATQKTFFGAEPELKN